MRRNEPRSRPKRNRYGCRDWHALSDQVDRFLDLPEVKEAIGGSLDDYEKAIGGSFKAGPPSLGIRGDDHVRQRLLNQEIAFPLTVRGDGEDEPYITPPFTYEDLATYLCLLCNNTQKNMFYGKSPDGIIQMTRYQEMCDVFSKGESFHSFFNPIGIHRFPYGLEDKTYSLLCHYAYAVQLTLGSRIAGTRKSIYHTDFVTETNCLYLGLSSSIGQPAELAKFRGSRSPRYITGVTRDEMDLLFRDIAAQRRASHGGRGKKDEDIDFGSKVLGACIRAVELEQFARQNLEQIGVTASRDIAHVCLITEEPARDLGPSPAFFDSRSGYGKYGYGVRDPAKQIAFADGDIPGQLKKALKGPLSDLLKGMKSMD